jgi:outer membrane protein OmpA-like peptidoglycan-associated protein
LKQSTKGGLMKLLVIAVVILALYSSNILAVETAGRSALSLKGGLNVYQGEIKDQQFKFYGDISVFGWMNDYLGLKLRGGVGILEASAEDQNFHTYTYTFGPMLMYKPFFRNPLNLYLTAGFEMMQIDPRYTTDHDLKLPNNQNGQYNHLQWAVPVGLGFSVFMGDNVSLDLEGLYHQAGTDYIDDIKAGKWGDSFISASLGLTMYLSGPPDADGDGIIDKVDKDPYHPEDFDNFEDTDGAPDYDNDNDGVPDIRDKAPNDPEDKDGFQDDDGVPDPDNDGDNVADANDKCPGTDKTVADSVNTKEDLDSFQDEDGCPDADNDGDGILDVKDKCPNEAETFNQYQDEDGCPDKKPEIDVKKGEAIILEGIYFATGSARLEPNSMTILDKVYRTLLENPEIEVEIRGFTDSKGKYASNVKLSQNRAESVRMYLVNKGIAAYRIVSKGYGPENPIDTNATKEGRARNRRIEFYRIK